MYFINAFSMPETTSIQNYDGDQWMHNKVDRYSVILLSKMLSVERIPDQLGYLLLTEDGAVLTSGGELENDERIANVLAGLVTLTDKLDPKAFRPNDFFHKITITYSDHCYIICLSNKKIHVLKRRLCGPSDGQFIDKQTSLDV